MQGADMRFAFAGGLLMAAMVASAPAVAADMPLKAPPAPVIAPTWTGTYIGINGGYGWGTSNHTNVVLATSNGDFDIKGGIAGVTYGGNWQAGHVVLGFESDFDWAHIDGVSTAAACGPGCFTNTKWLSTERMRAGWDFNGWLFYGTAGAAFARVDAGIVGCIPCVDKTRTGWAAGVGVETMFYQNWSAKIEYLHYDLGDSIHWSTVGAANGVTVLDRGDIIRAGINYHFDLLNLLHLN
jgi:outer membrane immunogenic protein